MNIKESVAVFLSAAVLFNSCVSFAEESGMDSHDISLDTQVISATGTLMDVDDTPIHTEVINAQQLKFMQAKVLTDALRFSSGLEISDTVKKGSKLSIQGMDANYILILKDGMPFISPTGSETDLSQISLVGIERIEIIKGAGSALYGSSAMAGVINLISKESNVSFVEVDLKHGVFQENASGVQEQQSLSATKVLGSNKFSTQLFHKFTPNHDLDDSNRTVNAAQQELSSIELRYDRHHGEKDKLGASSFIRINYLEDSKDQALNPLSYPGLGTFNNNYLTDSERLSLDAGIRQFSFDWLDQGDVSFRYEKYTEQSGNYDGLRGELTQRETDISLYKIKSQFNHNFQYLKYQNNLSYGVSAQQNTLLQTRIDGGVNEVDDEKSSLLETYVQNSVITPEVGEFVLGLRGQEDSDFGYYTNLKLNWMKELNLFESYESRIRFSYGQGYRAPDLKQRFYVFDHSNLGYIVLGNEDLKPEESDNYNTTLTINNDDVRFEWNLYYNDYKEKIETISKGVVDSISQYQYENIGKAKTYGQSLSLTVNPTQKLFVKNSLAYLSTENISTGKRLEGQPKWSYKTQLNYAVNKDLVFSLYGTVSYDTYNGMATDESGKDREAITDTIQSWDVKASYQLFKPLNVYASIDNLLNEQRSAGYNPITEVDERSIESRLYNLGMTLSF